jgi:hypothetical protein
VILSRIRPALAGLLLLVATGGAALGAEPVAVEITNRSQPILCAENDNVTIAFAGAGIAHFRLEASHPAYIGTLKRDSAAPDWSDCDGGGDPSFAPPAKPKRLVLYDGPRLRVVGFTFASFWRPASVPVRIGTHRTPSLHLIQLWVAGKRGWEEVLVLYPPDGYFRARPLTPPGLGRTAYGSSFLIGPIEEEGRPLVRLSEVAIDVRTRSVLLHFSRGGAASVSIAAIDPARNALDIAFDPPVVDAPFAMLRSMYVTETNNDVAHIALREPGTPGRREAGVLRFDKALATEIWAGRMTVSRHNSSAPDMLFRGFERRQ